MLPVEPQKQALLAANETSVGQAVAALHACGANFERAMLIAALISA